jgi:hypothetical protein
MTGQMSPAAVAAASEAEHMMTGNAADPTAVPESPQEEPR